MAEGIAIMTSGGDSAGMNSAVKAAVEHATRKGYKPYLIYDGLEGLIDGKIFEATRERVSGIMHRGGTVLRSSRSTRFFDISYRKIAYDHLVEHHISKLVVIGGDGSFRALNQFYDDFGVPFAGIPATIDNDIAGTDYCLGVDTALNIIRQSVDAIRDTASSFSRAFVVEVMGRHCGYLAATTALACGAEICIVPEVEYNLASIEERLHREIKDGRTYALAIVAEGSHVGEHITKWLGDTLKVETRLTVLGHVQRGGSPTVYDRIMAYKFAVHAIDALHAGETNSIMVYRNGAHGRIPIQEVTRSKYLLDSGLIDFIRPLAN